MVWMTSLGNGRINSLDVSSKNTSCFSLIQTLKFRMLELYCSRVLRTNRSSLISAAIVVPSRRSVLLEVHDDIILLRICLYYVFNDCTKTGSTRVTGRIQLQRGLVYVTGVWNPDPRNGNLFTILIVNRNNISKKCFYLRFVSIYSFSPLKSRFLFFE